MCRFAARLTFACVLGRVFGLPQATEPPSRRSAFAYCSSDQDAIANPGCAAACVLYSCLFRLLLLPPLCGYAAATGSVAARHGPWATKRRAQRRNGGATAARRVRGACIAPRATPIPTGRTARRKKCAPCPCPRRPGCLAGLRVSRPGSAPFASTPPPPLPILGPKMASGGGAWRAVARAGAGPRTWDSACGPRPMVPSGVRGGWPRPSTHARATPAPGGHRSGGLLGRFRQGMI